MLYNNLAINGAGHLVFAGYDTVELAQTYGTPLMVMDEERIRSRCREYKRAMAEYLPAGSYPLSYGTSRTCTRTEASSGRSRRS